MHGEAFTYMRQTLAYPEPQLGSARADTLPDTLAVVRCLGM